jgi:hypothetical protein
VSAAPARGLAGTVVRGLVRAPALLLSVPVWIYRKVISPCKPPTCRFRPTCSAYALEALRVHGALRGSWLATKRICRCHPFTEPGFDPVPPPRSAGPATSGEPRHEDPGA